MTDRPNADRSPPSDSSFQGPVESPPPDFPEAELIDENAEDSAFGESLLEGLADGPEGAALIVEAGPDAPAASLRSLADEESVAASLSSALPTVPESEMEAPGEVDWASETSAQRVYLELKKVEDEVRLILEPKDPVRKRKLGGTRRWRDLEEDLLNWRFTDRFDEATLARVQALAARRHQLFQRLRFLAGTRPTWNS